MHEPTEAQAAFATAQQESLQGREARQVSPDLVVGSGRYEIAALVPCRTPMPNTIHRFLIFQQPWIRRG